MYTAPVPRRFPPDLADCTGFEWDAGNNNKNWRKHGVSREEAEQVFSNRPLLVVLATDEDAENTGARPHRFRSLAVRRIHRSWRTDPRHLRPSHDPIRTEGP